MPPLNKRETVPTTLTVSQLNRQVKRMLEGHFDYIWIEGELSNLAQPASGHWYFSLKDENAQVRCAMFRNANQRVRFAPKNGQQLRLRARVSLYEGRGEFQLIVEHMEEAGAGALQRAFEQLKAKLEAEGLFAPDRKRPLPAFPRQVGIISSPTGAALRDIISVFRRRFPIIDLKLLPVPVQGVDAAPAIVAALAAANRDGGFDALILARGGGSIEDLWAFNEEQVARAVVDSAIPVVSAVGHEIDFTIADFAADQRAPTPSAAAELLSPDGREIAAGLQATTATLQRQCQRRLAQLGFELQALKRQLRHPGERLREQAQRLDDLDGRLRRSVVLGQRHRGQMLALQLVRLQGVAPWSRIEALQLRMAHLAARAGKAALQRLGGHGQALATLSGKLDSLSPLATLQRGYAIVSSEQGRLITGTDQVDEGQVISTRFADGSVKSRVLTKD